MKKFDVLAINGHPQFSIEGKSLVEAIADVKNFKHLTQVFIVGKTAGYQLESVSAHYAGDIFGGRGGAELMIKWRWLNRLNQPEKQVKMMIAWIHATPEDLPEPHTFDIGPERWKLAVKPQEEIDGEQIILILPGGYTMRSAGDEHELGSYVRFVDSQGHEVVYWDKQEWADEPEEVVGDILAIIQDPTKLVRFAAQRRREAEEHGKK